MTDSPLHPGIGRGASWAGAVARSKTDLLRAVVIAGGIMWAIAFVVIGLAYGLQMYGDGAMFSYAVAAQDAWAFHWHNISGRLTVYVLSLLPAEAYVGLTGDPGGAIAVYGFLFFAAPLFGLIATFAADHSKGRIIFSYACFSTACLGSLVFGFPTEMWLAHALFWPTLAVAHGARRTVGGTALLFTLLLMLIFSHEGALVLAAAILVTLALRGLRDPLLLRGAGALVAAVAMWAAVKLTLPPDAYFADVLARAARDFFDRAVFSSPLVLLIAATLVTYAAVVLVLRRWVPEKAPLYAAAIVAVALAAYWIFADHALHAADRYYLRTLLVIVAPVLGLLASVQVLNAGAGPLLPLPGLPRIVTLLSCRAVARAVAGAFVLVMLVHAVETAKFVVAWTKYKAAVAAFATGTVSDPSLGDPRFVSSERIGASLNRLSWFSTTPYLSAIVANFAPARLVMDPRRYNYFWLSCETATASVKAERAVPPETRELVRVFSCLHR